MVKEEIMKKKYVLWVILTFFIGILAGVLVSGKLFSDSKKISEPYKGLYLIARAMGLIDKNYVDKVEPEKIVVGALRGMGEALDPFTTYLTKDEKEKLSNINKYAYSGFEVDEAYGFPIVGDIFREDLRKNLKKGDLIKRIDDVSTYKIPYINALLMLVGKEGEKRELKILRGEEKKPLKVYVELKKKPNFTFKTSKNGLYIALHFINSLSSIREIEKIIKRYPSKEVIVDLRKVFLIKNELVKEISKVFTKRSFTVKFSGNGGKAKVIGINGKIGNRKLIVLIDGSTVFSSALLAYILKKGGGELFGEKTHSKTGLMCGYEYDDGSLYYAVCYSNEVLWEKGVLPDVKFKKAKMFKDLLKGRGFGEL